MLRVALVQMLVGADKQANVARAGRHIRAAKAQGAQLIVLPECFNSPYGVGHFASCAEPVPDGPSATSLSRSAAEHAVHIIGGSVPEQEGDKLFNTCAVFAPDGALCAKYRKVHLFDVDIPGKLSFSESSVLSPGSALSYFDVKEGGEGGRGEGGGESGREGEDVGTEGRVEKRVKERVKGRVRIGLGICYDLRFPELALSYARHGCNVLVYPSAFTVFTGPKYWRLLQQARAVDCQSFVITCSPADGDPGESDFRPYGHSMIVKPDGAVLAEIDGSHEAVLIADLDMSVVEEVRQSIPIWRQKRDDVYRNTSDVYRNTSDVYRNTSDVYGNTSDVYRGP